MIKVKAFFFALTKFLSKLNELLTNMKVKGKKYVQNLRKNLNCIALPKIQSNVKTKEFASFQTIIFLCFTDKFSQHQIDTR